MDTLLVTGGAGFIGGHFVRQMLARRTARVVNLDILSHAGCAAILASLATSDAHVFVQGDIGDRALVADLLQRYEIRAVINFAAETHVDRSIVEPARFVRANVLATFELLDASLAYWESLTRERRERFRFLHVSTDEVYGSLPATGHFTESTPYAPNSPYSASKAASDHFVRAYHHTYGLPTLVTHCSNNYGPYQFPEKLIPLTILNLLDGRPAPVYGRGNNVRDWLHVEDHCRALEMVFERGLPGETYNIGGNCERTNLDVVQTICRAVDAQRPETPFGPSTELIRFVTDRPGHDFRYAIDASKIRNQLGWLPTVPFAEGVDRTIRWYRENSEFVAACSAACHRERLGLRNTGSTAKR